MRRLTHVVAACLLPLAMLPSAHAAMQATAPATASTAQSTFSLPQLPYAANALDPAIDAETMKLHHGKHHQAYVDALNKAVAADKALSGQTLEQLVGKAGTLSDTIRNNAGGHWNHTFFWKTMAPQAQAGSPSAELNKAITSSFGSMDKFKASFKEAGTKRFGSGWVWLIVDKGGKLAITSTPNQDNPLMDVAEQKGMPILGNDVWEHAYYLKYQNRRADYLDGWWKVVNWAEVSRRYAEATAKK